MTQAAASRAEPYRVRDELLAPPAPPAGPPSRPAYVQRGVSPDELERLQKPAVRRLANVTQLCKCLLNFPSPVFFVLIVRLSA
jgi:hypothetical protein